MGGGRRNESTLNIREYGITASQQPLWEIGSVWLRVGQRLMDIAHVMVKCTSVVSH
jgi:hypothetical protein